MFDVTHRRAWVRRGLAVAALALAALVGSVALDRAADRQILRRHDEWTREVAQDRIRAASYRRPIVFGPPLDQNAADWYRQAFSRPGEPTRDEFAQLTPLLDQGPGQDERIPPGIDAVCRDTAAIAHVSQALRCTRCDWQLDYEMGGSSVFDHNARAVALVDCLTLTGHRAVKSRSYGSAAESYLQVIALGCDLGAGNLIMNIVGVGAAKRGLAALGRLLTTIDYDPLLFSDVAGRVRKLQPCLPTVHNGVRIDRLQAANALIAEALTPVTAGTRPLNPVFPWHAFAAWHLSRDMALVTDLAGTATMADPQERFRVVNDLQRRAAASSNPFVKEFVAGSWSGAVDEANALVHDAHAVLAIIDIEQWHQQHGRYPDSRADAPSLADDDGVRYERDPDGRGYSLVAISAVGTPQRLARRSADRPAVVR